LAPAIPFDEFGHRNGLLKLCGGKMATQRLLAALAIGIVPAFMSLDASAVPIAVPNFSFENPDVLPAPPR
jgi:hypothetical protein